MKKLIALLMVLMMCLPAMAETPAEPDAAELLSPFVFTLPEGVRAQMIPGNTSVTYVHANGTTRAVASVISRVPDPEGDHAAELRQLMELFAPRGESYTPLALEPGFHGLMALIPDALEGLQDTKVDQITVMVLWQTETRGELLILSAYDLDGVADNAQALLTMLLRNAAVEGVPVVEPLEAAQE